MDLAFNTVPTNVASLLVAYVSHTATKHELDRLDQWLKASDQHIEIFEECLTIAQRPKKIYPDTQENFDSSINISPN